MLDYLFNYRKGNSSVPISSIEDAIVQIEDTLYYFSDVMSSGIPDLERFITENILRVLVFRFLLPSLQRQSTVSAEKHFTYYII
jgi:protein CLEC16A